MLQLRYRHSVLSTLIILTLLLVSGLATANTVLEFDGNDYLQAANDASLNPTDAITIEFWCMIPGPFNDLGNSPLIEKAFFSHSSPWYQYHLGVNSGSQEFLFDLAIDGSRHLLRSPLGALPYGEWVHVAGTYDGTTMRLHVNGNEVSQRPASGALSNYDTDVIIGRFANFNAGIVGQIDDVRLWNTARTPVQINDMMCAQLDGTEIGLIAGWGFNEGDGSVAADISANGNDATFGTAPNMDPAWTSVQSPQCPDTVTEVQIDVHPGSDENWVPCDPFAKSVTPVALLTTDTFDATTVDPATVRFGPSAASEAHVNRHGTIRHVEDVDGDGDLDLIFHFSAAATGVRCGDTSVMLTGETFDGREFRGSDMIQTRAHKPGRPDESVLVRLSPNPFNPQTIVSFVIDEGQNVRVEVYDIRGRRVALLADREFAAGEHGLVWAGRDSDGGLAPSGQYFFRIAVGDEVLIRKALLLK